MKLSENKPLPRKILTENILNLVYICQPPFFYDSYPGNHAHFLFFFSHSFVSKPSLPRTIQIRICIKLYKELFINPSQNLNCSLVPLLRIHYNYCILSSRQCRMRNETNDHRHHHHNMQYQRQFLPSFLCFKDFPVTHWDLCLVIIR